jgi:LytR cell envelope-related transcriptional attenuator
MENQTSQQNMQQVSEPIHESVSFPAPQPEQSGGFPKWIFAVVGLLIILAGGGFFLYQGSVSAPTPTPTPFVATITALASPTAVPTVAPTASPTPSVLPTPSSAQRTAISIEVQNGTGTTGDAGVAKAALEKAGYSKVTTANATSQNATETTLTYSSDVSMSVVNEIASALKVSFGNVVPTQATTGTAKVTVVTGPKQASATQTTASSKATATPAASPATRTISPTATATSTPR